MLLSRQWRQLTESKLTSRSPSIAVREMCQWSPRSYTPFSYSPCGSFLFLSLLFFVWDGSGWVSSSLASFQLVLCLLTSYLTSITHSHLILQVPDIFEFFLATWFLSGLSPFCDHLSFDFHFTFTFSAAPQNDFQNCNESSHSKIASLLFSFF